MVEDTGHELAGWGRDVVLGAAVVEAVDALLLVPAREVEVAAVPRLITPGLGREGRIATVPEGDATHCLAIDDVAVRRLQRGRVTNRDYLLAPAELGVVRLDCQALGLQRGDDLVDDGSRDVHAR